MSRLHYTIDSEIALTEDPKINALVQDNLPGSGAYDIAFTGVANFLSGDYKQNSSDINDIVSNVAIDTNALNNAHFFLVTGGHDTRGATYANSINTGAYFYGASAANKVQLSNGGSVDIDGLLPYGSAWIPMTDVATGVQSSKVNDDGVLLNDQSSVADGLLQAVTAALFTKIGKNAAILNDAPMHGTLQTNFNSGLGTVMNEDSKDYANSKFFKRYLESGRYASENHDTNIKDYNMDNTLVNMIVNISGTVSDTDNIPVFNQSVIQQIFGSDTKIQNDGSYHIKVFVSLLNDVRF